MDCVCEIEHSKAKICIRNAYNLVLSDKVDLDLVKMSIEMAQVDGLTRFWAYSSFG